jgi:PAS domain S-box-containing protein
MDDSGRSSRPPPPEQAEAEARLALAIAAGRMAVWDFDLASDRILGSPELYALFGFPPGVEPTTDEIRSRYYPGERERIQAEGFAAVLRGERFVENEIRHLWPDGSIRWALLRAEAIFDSRGRPMRALGIVMDITDRKRNEAALRAEQARLTLAKAAAGFGVWDWDLSDNTVTWSPEIFDLLGIDHATGGTPGIATWFRAIDRRDRARASDVVRAAVVASQPFTVDFRLRRRRPGAVERWLRSQGAPVPGADAAQRYVGVNLDVTEEHRREERLLILADDLREAAARAQREREHLSELSNELFAAIGPDGEMTAHNRAWSTLVGEAALDLRRKPFLGLLHAGDRAEAETALNDVRAGAALRRFEARLSRIDDVVVWTAWTVAAEGGIVYAVGRDVTLEKARDAALAQTQKMEALGQLTGGVAHDFNNLLQALSGYLELIRRQPTDAARVARWADNALLASERGTRLTGQLLAFSRNQNIEVAAVPLAPMFASLADILQRTLGGSVLTDIVAPAANLCVLADPTQLETALINLAVNARDAMPAGGRLHITADAVDPPSDAHVPAGDYVAIAVSDTGVGMPAGVASRAFDPFFTTKGVGKGTGLGLSQVYGMARHAGGWATLDSRLGLGTTVTILLRRASASQQGGQEAAGGPVRTWPDTAAAKILVVDDDAEVRALLSDMLPALGYVAEFQADGSGALAALEQGAPDLMILDFAMPGMNGAEVARAARLRHPDLKIVLASGYADTVQIVEAVGPEFILLRKPFSMGDLAETLARLLAGGETVLPG